MAAKWAGLVKRRDSKRVKKVGKGRGDEEGQEMS